MKKMSAAEMLFAGFGGQGIMFMGKLLAQAGLLAGKHVTWMPSYGAEVRGGTAYSMTKISDKEIANPVVTNPDILVAMNKPSLMKYSDRLKPHGLLVSNSTLDGAAKKKGVTLLNLPLTEIASKLGNTKCANMIAVGAILKRSNLLPMKYVIAALKEMLSGKEDLLAINRKALEEGYRRVNKG